MSYHVLAVFLDFHFPYVHSLKEKRGIVKKIQGRLQNQFSSHFSEIDFHDKWQRSRIATAWVSNDTRLLDRMSKKLLDTSESLFGEYLSDFQIEWR